MRWLNSMIAGLLSLRLELFSAEPSIAEAPALLTERVKAQHTNYRDAQRSQFGPRSSRPSARASTISQCTTTRGADGVARPTYDEDANRQGGQSSARRVGMYKAKKPHFSWGFCA